MPFSPVSLLPFLADRYAGGPFVLEATLQTKGQRAAFLLRGERGRVVAKVSEPGRDRAIVERDAGTLAALAQGGLAVPMPIRDRRGELVLPFEDRLVYLYHYIEGTRPRVEAGLYARLGALLAELHSLPVDAAMPIPTSAYRPPAILNEVRAFLQNVPDKPTQRHAAEQRHAAAQRAAAEDVLGMIERFPSFAELPEGVIHTDPYFVNLLDGADGRLYLIDWDDGGISYPLMDVGYVLAHLTSFLAHDRVNLQLPGPAVGILWRTEWGEAFLRAYEAIRPLTVAERRLLPWAMRLAVIAYLPLWGTNEIILENYERMKGLEEGDWGLEIGDW